MAYPQDLVGKFINFRVDPGGAPSGGVGQILPGQTTATSVAVYSGSVPPLIGTHRVIPGGLRFLNTNSPWHFTFLKYVAGSVTTAPLTGGVLTGPMSGCYLCRYAQGGQQGLAHIGTYNTPDSPESVAVKAAWRQFVALPNVSGVQGGSPFDYFPTQEFQAAMLGPGSIPLVCGFFAGGGAAHAVLLAPVPSSMHPPVPLLKVAALKTMTLQPWATIAALRTFRD